MRWQERLTTVRGILFSIVILGLAVIYVIQRVFH